MAQHAATVAGHAGIIRFDDFRHVNGHALSLHFYREFPLIEPTDSSAFAVLPTSHITPHTNMAPISGSKPPPM